MRSACDDMKSEDQCIQTRQAGPQGLSANGRFWYANERRMGYINEVINGQETEYTQSCLELFSTGKGQVTRWTQSFAFQESFCVKG